MDEIKIPKEYLKRKNVMLYKAYVMDDGAEMSVNTDIDVFGITEEAAVQHMINSMSIDDIANLIGKDINFLVVAVDKGDFLNKPCVDKGDVYFKDNCLAFTLNGKMFKIDLVDKHITELKVAVNDKNEIKIINNLIMT